MELTEFYKGYCIRYMQLTGTTVIEDEWGYVLQDYPQKGIRGVDLAKAWVDDEVI